MEDSKNDKFSNLSVTLCQRRIQMEKNSKENDLYDFAGQCFHREMCGIPENTHNSVIGNLI